MTNEDEVTLSVYKPHHAHYGAFILSVLWNLIVIFCLFFLARQKQNIKFNVQHDPLVTFQNPTTPTPIPQSIASPQMPVQPTQPISQQLPQALQQVARQQPLALPEPDQEKLNYLVRQLISLGNQISGAVVSAVDDVPGSAGQATSEQPIEEKKQVSQSNIAEKTTEPVQESQEAETTQDEGPQTENRESEIADQPISQEDMVLLQETAQAIAATMPAESTVFAANQATPAKKSSAAPIRAPQAKRGPSQSNSRPTLTLADIAGSFMKQVRNERQIKYNYDPQKKGSGMPGVCSPVNKACDGKELALQLYATKVFMLMQQSARTLSSLIYAQSDFTTNSLLEITIDQDGKLVRTVLNPPINEKDIEQAVQTIVQRVGLFPPVPKHFNTDTITLTFPLNIQGSKGFGRYSLSYSVAGRP